MTAATQSGRVLIVDDSPLEVDIIADALTQDRWQVAKATDGTAALAMARSWSPDVVVSDLHMPGIDGLQLLARLRDFDPSTPVVMTSSEDNLTVVLRAVHAGVYDFVPKGSDSRTLASAVARAALHAQTMRDNQRLSAQLRQANLELERRVEERTSELSRANGELQNLMTKLIATERLAAIGQLAAGVAHEINNPLSYVVSNLAYVRGCLADLERVATEQPGLEAALQSVRRSGAGRSFLPELQQALVEAEDGAKRISEIVRDVRTMSRTDDRSRGRFDVNAAIRSATRIAGEPVRRRARLMLDLHDGLEVMGSVGRLTQVMVNLLVNAADAIEDAHGRDHFIRVTSRREAGGVVVAVADTGSGIAADQLSRIFDPFFTTKPEGRGTGLGLSICHDIVTTHGGSIAVTSTHGSGTTFTVTLPAA